MKIIIAGALLSVLGSNGFSQSLTGTPREKMMDSIRFSYFQMAALKYPTIRQASISTDFVSGANAHSKLYDKSLYDGKEQITRVKAHFTVPVLSWGKNTITSTFGMINQHLNLNNVTSYNPQMAVNDTKLNLTSFNFLTSYTRSDSLFNKPFTFSVGALGLTNESFNQLRMVYTGFASINLIRNPVTSLSVGFALISDPSSATPIIPLISYSRKFAGIDMELLADLPSRVILRKELSAKNFISVGSELTGNSFLFNFSQPGLPKDAISTTLIIKSGVTFERLVAKNVVVGLSAGIYTSPSSKVMGKNDRPSDYFIKTKSMNEPYLNLSVSFLPFWRGFRLKQ